MNKKRYRIIIDVSMWFLFAFMLGTGLLMQYRLVPGSKGGHGLSLFGLSRHEWGEFHLWAAYLFLACLCIHLFLNFSFIKNVIAKRLMPRILLLSLSGLVVVAFFLFTPMKREESPGRLGGGSQTERVSDAEGRLGLMSPRGW